ncbi:DNA alkylation repair protein [uncultured Paraglaciecola sp.]|uniref:DNA alkylation repair protein n=1 Tax=uncultured Paraglaciecola sp. TaxID=1765024 RepID=UPI0025D53A87|nr:DNA alkylation repair protein [uncultured Paraglaciecola sp.]
MAEPLKNNYGIDIVTKISNMLQHVDVNFDSEGFVAHVQQGYDSLELMERGRKIATALKVYLPDDFKSAVEILIASLDSPVEHEENNSIASFIFLPHTIYVTDNGLNDFDTSMQAHYQLTQRFTSEFAIRPFIQRYPEKCLALLKLWANDSNQHVRRLVSEGTRTRLPWASRLPEFIQDPSPVIVLLELLKDDPELYVRRSVANNLNDIGKDHPELLANIAKRWLNNASKDRIWLVKHSLRSAIKRGEKGALEALGYGQVVDVKIQQVNITPEKAKMGSSVQINFELINQSRKKAALMVDFSILFIKANGKANPKVFKLKAIEIEPAQTLRFSKKVSLKAMTTRILYAGKHQVEVIINGQRTLIGHFDLNE